MANSLGATYAHLLCGEDGLVAALCARQPMFADSWEGRTGLSELSPRTQPGTALLLSPSWHDWGRCVRVDLPALHAFGRAVHQAADDYLASLSADELDQPVDLVSVGFGERSLAWFLSAGLVGHVLSHWGDRLPEGAARRPGIPGLGSSAPAR